MKRWLWMGVLATSVALLLRGKEKGDGKRRSSQADGRGEDGRERGRDAADLAARRFILYVIFPAWCVPGLLDWYWHKSTKIETTSGVPESITHVVMMIEAGVPILLGMFLEINAGVLALMLGGALIHELTVVWDVWYTAPRRKIPAGEQHTHSFMETIPFNVAATMATLHPEQFMALFGAGAEKPRFELRLRKPPMPMRHVLYIVGAATALVFLPHIEELWRCVRAREQGLMGAETPGAARELYG